MTAPKVEGHCDPKFSKLADIFSASIKSGFDDGGSLCLEIENEVVVDMWGGFKDQEHTKSWDENTIANVFSVTKAMTATCALKLLEDKKINLGDRVTRYWPEYDCKSKGDTTIKDFFSHRAGMFGFQEPLPYECWEDWDLIVNQLAKQEPFHKPGTAQGYHAMTFGFLLGEIIRRVDGRSVGTFFKEEIADIFDVDFKIGLQESDFERCADLIMQEAPINVINFFRRIPRWLLPSRIRMIGDTLSSTEYRKAFIEILRTEDQKCKTLPRSQIHPNGEKRKSLQPMDTVQQEGWQNFSASCRMEALVMEKVYLNKRRLILQLRSFLLDLIRYCSKDPISLVWDICWMHRCHQSDWKIPCLATQESVEQQDLETKLIKSDLPL